MPRAAGCVVLIGLCLAMAGCQVIRSLGPNRASRNPSRIPADDIQAEVMAFTDSYTAIISQAIDRISRALPHERAALHDAKVRNVQNAIIIAAGPNPVGSLLDMTVMVSLQRQIAEEYWIPQRFGPEAQPLVDALVLLEREILLIADRALDDEQYEALQALIPVIRERFKDQVFVSSIRASDFAIDRRTVVSQIDGGGSLLTLFQLDPLAGLSPAAQELAQTRLLAERTFFWAKRLPTLMNWQFEDVVMKTFNEPELQRFVDANQRFAEATARFSDTVADYPRQLSEERDAAFHQMSELMTAEREAALQQALDGIAAEREIALEQAFEAVAAEREALFRTFEDEDVRLRGLLEDVRATIQASTALSESLTTTIESTERLRAGFERSPDNPRRDDAPPFDINDYTAMAEATTASAEKLNEVIVSLNELLASPAWEDRNAQVEATAVRAQTTLESLIDRSFRRGLILIGVLVVGSLIAAILYRSIIVRLLPARG